MPIIQYLYTLVTSSTWNISGKDSYINFWSFLLVCVVGQEIYKVNETAIAILRMEGHITAIYIDDLINVGHTFDECCKNIDACINLLQYLGFTIHGTKYVLEPKQTLAFLEFCINSVNMTVKLST